MGVECIKNGGRYIITISEEFWLQNVHRWDVISPEEQNRMRAEFIDQMDQVICGKHPFISITKMEGGK